LPSDPINIDWHSLYGPAVCCKLDVTDVDMTGLAHLYSALSTERLAPGHNGYPHTSALIRVKALEGRMCHQITDATVGPFLHLLNPTRRPRRESSPGCWLSDPLLILPGEHVYSITLRLV